MGKTFIYRVLECVLLNVLSISLIKIIQKHLRVSLEMKSIDQGYDIS